MTNREFFTAVINANLSAEMTEFATGAIAKLDATNSKRVAKNAEKAESYKPEIDALVAQLTNEPQTASDLVNVLGVSVQKTSNRLRMAVAQGRAAVVDVKVKGKGVQKGYILAE